MSAPAFGVGFRPAHFAALRRDPSRVDWLEALSDNYLGIGGERRAWLEDLRRDSPLVLHGVALSIAGATPLPDDYLSRLRALSDELQPLHVSDHLCWTALGGHQSHDLLPVAYTEEVLAHVAQRVEQVQERLGRRILLENPSAYVRFAESALGEAEFLVELCERTGCGILLDINNLFVNYKNLDLDPAAYLKALPAAAIGYMHLAGHAVLSDVRIDTHDAAIPEAVWQLYEEAASRFPEAGVIVEWDAQLPPFETLASEVSRARAIHSRARDAAPDLAPRAVAHTLSFASPAAQRRPWPELQRDFFARVVDKPLGFDHSEIPHLGELLDDGRSVRAARGMRVYSDAYTASLREALALNFPALEKALRARDFDAMAARYLSAHPPQGFGFAALGRALPAFLRSDPLASGYAVPARALADLAALEQAQIEVSEAPDEAEPVAAAALAAIDESAWETARFRFTRALCSLRSGFDVLPAVEAVERGEDPPLPAERSSAYLVSRSRGLLRIARSEVFEADLIDALVAGRSFGEACALDSGSHFEEGDRIQRAAAALVGAFAQGLVLEILGST
jgi:uncharacterized protein (UPF0276 family)